MKSQSLNQKEGDFICTYHDESYISFCKDCNKNLCFCCEVNHKSHNIIYFGQIMPSQNEVNSEMNEFRKNIYKFKTIIEKLKDNLNEIYRNTVKYYYIYLDKIEKFKEKKRNYEIINKALAVKDDYIIKNLKNMIIENSKIEKKFSTIFNIKYKLDENTFIKNYNLPHDSDVFFKDNNFEKKEIKKEIPFHREMDLDGIYLNNIFNNNNYNNDNIFNNNNYNIFNNK